MLAASTRPNHQAGACSWRKANATMKVRKPTIPRSTPMAVAAIRTEAACSSAAATSGWARRSAPGAGRTRRKAAMAVRAKTRAASRTTHGAPRGPILSTMIPGTEAANPAITDSTASRELAPTSSPWPATVLGTRALLVTM